MNGISIDPALTKPDILVLRALAADIRRSLCSSQRDDTQRATSGLKHRRMSCADTKDHDREENTSDDLTQEIEDLAASNDPAHPDFEPTVLTGTEFEDIWLPKQLLGPYIRFARSLVRFDADVVMVTHLLLYLLTSVPSAAYLFWNFTWIHGILHFAMQVSYMGPYTLMMHQHIHMRGLFSKQFRLFDQLFPYVTDPLMGHTWNSYHYHHVKHHHVEGNGPYDLSSTIRYQRDDLVHFLMYTARFYFLIWLDLPLYFIRKGHIGTAAKVAFWEMSWCSILYILYRARPGATFFVFLLPLFLLRAGLMLGNWGQHAFVDHNEPDSDYRSSITLVDVPSNRYCFNDGYHTSHHLNPLRHWRAHPIAFLQARKLYAEQGALVFHNIDYLMITVRLLMKDYHTLALCMVPIGDQISMTLNERIALLKDHTRRFTDEEIATKFSI